MQAQHIGTGGKMPRKHTGVQHIVEAEGSITGSSGTGVRGTAEVKGQQRRHWQSTAVAGTHEMAAVAKRST